MVFHRKRWCIDDNFFTVHTHRTKCLVCFNHHHVKAVQVLSVTLGGKKSICLSQVSKAGFYQDVLVLASKKGFPNSRMGLSTGWWTQASYFSPRWPTCQARGFCQSTKSCGDARNGQNTIAQDHTVIIHRTLEVENVASNRCHQRITRYNSGNKEMTEPLLVCLHEFLHVNVPQAELLSAVVVFFPGPKTRLIYKHPTI